MLSLFRSSEEARRMLGPLLLVLLVSSTSRVSRRTCFSTSNIREALPLPLLLLLVEFKKLLSTLLGRSPSEIESTFGCSSGSTRQPFFETAFGSDCFDSLQDITLLCLGLRTDTCSFKLLPFLISGALSSPKGDSRILHVGTFPIFMYIRRYHSCFLLYSFACRT